MSKTTEELNKDIFQEEYKYYKTSCKKMIRAFIQKSPKPILIEVLKDLKIIERDWFRNHEKYVEKL